MRPAEEIKTAETELFEKLWYDRHKMLANKRRIDPQILVEAEKMALQIEIKYRGKLGPYNDLHWGMLLGKLSALRWVLGYEWDFLDT